jgi:hypothetical protein
LFSGFVEIARVIERSTTAPMIAVVAFKHYGYSSRWVSFMLSHPALFLAGGAAQ